MEIRTSRTPEEVAAIVQGVLSDVTQGAVEKAEIAALYDACGFALLQVIKSEYIVKARGGVDAAGIRWPPLTRPYLAYGRRFGRGEKAALKQDAGLTAAHRYAPGGKDGLLSKQQLKDWRKWYFVFYTRLLLQKVDPASAKRRAAQIAWSILKRQGARTKLDVFGNRVVEIMRDTGVLFASLTYTYTKHGIHLGSPVAYAGDAFKRRPAWPANPEQFPEEWLEPVYDVLVSGLLQIITDRVGDEK